MRCISPAQSRHQYPSHEAGWPTFSLNLTHSEAAPPLRILQGWEMFIRHSVSANQSLRWGMPKRLQAMLWRGLPAFHYLELLSPSSDPGDSPAAQSVSGSARAGAPPLRVCRRRLCGHAGALPFADQRTAEGDALDRDASAEAALCPENSKTVTGLWRPSPGPTLGRRAGGRTRVAAALLRFRGLEPRQATGEAPLHPPQSGQAWVGAGAGAMAVEQFSTLRL